VNYLLFTASHRWRVAIGVLALAAAIFILQLHVRIGPARTRVGISWAPGTSEAVRQAAETGLGLRDGYQTGPDAWAYHVADRSRAAVRRIIDHPLIVSTDRIYRAGARVLVVDSRYPRLLLRALEEDLGPPMSLAAALIGFVLLWLERRQLRQWVDSIHAWPHLELAAAALCLGIGFAFFYDNGQSVDENVHYDQIRRLAQGDRSMNAALTMLPGFHAIVAALVWPLGVSNFSVRLAVFALSIATVAAFHWLARTFQPEHAASRTLQFTLLPILFPQFFLIYTDVTSVLFVLLMMLAAGKRRYALAGILGLLSCLVRQDNAVWVVFAAAWSYLRDYGWTWKPAAHLATRYATFIATGVAFLLFVAVNHGQVALGDDVGSHPLRTLHVTNIFFLMFLTSFFFVPLWWGYRREIAARLLRWWPWLSLVVLFPIFWFGFVNDHPHNTERADFFLRNAILIYFSATPIRKLLFFLPVAFAWLCLPAVPMTRAWRLLYPFTVVFLLPEWLVEQRYYLIPLSLWLLAREQTPPWTERLQTALFFVMSVGLFVIIERKWGWM
jgi:alpha-1,2-glucosyltransferase